MLAQVERVFGNDVHLQKLLEIELIRHAGNEERALQLWAELDSQTRVIREEAMHLPELMAWASQRDLEVPKRLEHSTKTTIKVQFGTKAEICINGRWLAPLEYTQDILVLRHLLLFQERHIETDELAIVVFKLEETIESKKTFVQDLVDKIIDRLRYRLEFPESVCDDKKSYWLDPNTIWEFEVLK